MNFYSMCIKVWESPWYVSHLSRNSFFTVYKPHPFLWLHGKYMDDTKSTRKVSPVGNIHCIIGCGLSYDIRFVTIMHEHE